LEAEFVVALAEAAEEGEAAGVLFLEGFEFEDELDGLGDAVLGAAEVGEGDEGVLEAASETVGLFEVTAEAPPGMEIGEGREGGLEAELLRDEAACASVAFGAVEPGDEPGLVVVREVFEAGVAAGFAQAFEGDGRAGTERGASRQRGGLWGLGRIREVRVGRGLRGGGHGSGSIRGFGFHGWGWWVVGGRFVFSLSVSFGAAALAMARARAGHTAGRGRESGRELRARV
jgi:hypothetical protein